MKAHAWIMDRVRHDGPDCLMWPYAKDSRTGRGFFALIDPDTGVKKHFNVQRYMCEQAHGPCPSDQHRAYLTCRTRGCCHPGHLAWRTKTELGKLQASRRDFSGASGVRAKLTQMEIDRVRYLKIEKGLSYFEVERATGVNMNTVAYWVHLREKRGHHKGIITRCRVAGRLTYSEKKEFGIIKPRVIGRTPKPPSLPRLSLSYPFIRSTPTDAHHAVLLVNSLVPRWAICRDDICQEILAAYAAGELTLDGIGAEVIRRFKHATVRRNLENAGFTISLDAPRFDGRSWHDVLEAA